jgi:Matrixin
MVNFFRGICKTGEIKTTVSFTGIDFFSVAVHELGHSLGLAHSPERDSVMFPYFKGFNDNPARLAYDDVLAMYDMYGKNHFSLIPNLRVEDTIHMQISHASKCSTQTDILSV